MARLELTEDEAALHEVIGTRAFVPGRGRCRRAGRPADARPGRARSAVRDRHLCHAEDPSRRIAMRPVIPGRAGWVRTGISWSTLSYGHFGRSGDIGRYRRLLG